MRLATPRGWYRREGRGWRAGLLLLAPLSWIWAAVTARRLARVAPADPGIPVICVGNVTMGGSGKTPIARALAQRLAARGLRTAVLLRGHGGRLAGPLRVDADREGAEAVGDEALMLARAGLDVWIARDRLAGARAAAADGVEALIMDDGHQNPSVRKALSLIVVDGETRDGEWPFGDGRVFPAGPLREPLAAGLRRADAAIVLLPADLPAADPALLAALSPAPTFVARLAAAAPPAGRCLAFAGIAKPWKVERALRAAGADLVDFAPLPDHAPLSASLLAALEARAEALGASLLTTEKDAARLPAKWRERVTVWPVEAAFDDEAAIDALLDAALARNGEAQ